LWNNSLARTALSLTALAVAAWLVHLQLRNLTWAAFRAALAATPALAIGLSVLLTALSYACLSVAEWKVLKLVGRPLPFGRMLLPSLASNALSIVIGFGLFSGAAIRLRTYAFARMEASQIARLVLLTSLATWVGGAVALGLALLPAAVRNLSAAQGGAAFAVALALIALSVLWFTAFRRNGGALTMQDRLVLLTAGLGDWLFSGAALFVLESRNLAALAAFLSRFFLGSLVGSLAGVPGGLGVLEAVMLGLQGKTPVHETAAALVLYRAIYFLGPLLLTLMGIAAAWVLRKVRRKER
jgi:phosphatidylglycerol lysyltransferase